MTDFNTTRRRDAWATIRGYVYQVDTTLDRWIGLGPTQVLELERGEDIDLIQEALQSAAPEEQSRLLEQVKYSAVNITLRSPKALEALASFHEHLTSNPGQELIFRYVTNADVGREHGSTLEKNQPAIFVWQQLRGGTISGAERDSAIVGVRVLLKNAAKPEKLNKETWGKFISFVLKANDKDFLKFICGFEWHTQQTSFLNMAERIKGGLMARHGIQPAVADEVYARLFLRVFKLLSSPGIKLLTAEDLKTELALTPLTPADRALLLRLHTEFSNFELRIFTIEQEMSALKERTSELSNRQDELSSRQTATESFIYSAPGATSPGKALFDRTLLAHSLYWERAYVKDKLSRFMNGGGGYLFVSGQAGFGKTALLANVVKESPDGLSCYFFSRSGGLTDEQNFLNILIRQIRAHHRRKDQRLPTSYAELRALLIELLQTPAPEGRPVRVVIDALDEADFSPRPYFVPLGAGVSIIFSARPLPDREWLKELGLGRDSKVEEILLGAFTRDDVEGLLRLAGIVEDEKFDDLPALVEEVTAGDPFFVRILVDDLSAEPGKAYENITALAAQVRSEGGQKATSSSAYPALRQYLKTWWDEVSRSGGDESGVEDLLGHLTVARAPLTRSDLVKIDPGDALRGSNVDKCLAAVSRFVPGDEENGYSLCHPRFQEYLAGRMEDSVSLYRRKLSDYTMRWRETGSAYALRFMTAHLLEDKRYGELLTLLTPDFLSSKVKYFKSYAGGLQDLSHGLEAAFLTGEDARALGLALAHCSIQNRVVKMSSEVIPLLARFGETERALEMADLIRDDDRRAETLLSVAREALPQDPGLSRKIVRQVIENWRRYHAKFTCGDILRDALLMFPDDVFALLEQTDEFFPLKAFAGGINRKGSVRAEECSAYTPKLDPSLTEQMKAILKRALTLAKRDSEADDVRLLLVRLESDPEEAGKYATSDGTRLLVAAKRDERTRPGGHLRRETARELLRLLTGNLSHLEMRALLTDVAARHAREIRPLANEVDDAWERCRLLLELGLALPGSGSHKGEARKIFFDVLRVERGGRHSPCSGSYPLLRDFISLLIPSTVGASIRSALRLINLAPVRSVVPDESLEGLVADAIAALARTRPEAAFEEASARLRNPVHVARVAAETARVSLDIALRMWEGLECDTEEKQRRLARILISAPPSPRAKRMLETELQIGGGRHLFKVPAVADCAARIAKEQPEAAAGVINEALELAHRWLEKEGLGSLQIDLFIASLAPSAARSDFRHARLLLNHMREEYGLKAVASADMLRILTEDGDTRRFLSTPAFWKPGPRPFDAHGDRAPNENGKLARSLSRYVLAGRGCVVHGDWIFEAPRLRRVIDDAKLIELYVQHGRHEGAEWYSDCVNALLAVKTAGIRRRVALGFAENVRPGLLRDVTLAELCGKLPAASSQHLLPLISAEAARAVALARVAARDEVSGERRQGYLEQAFEAVSASLGEFADRSAGAGTGEDIYASVEKVLRSRLTIELLIEFVREARAQAGLRADHFSTSLIESVLASRSQRWGYCLLRLSACGYRFTSEELALLKGVARAETEVRTEEAYNFRDHTFYAERCTDVAASALQADPGLGLEFIERAASHASQVTERAARFNLHIGIVDALLTSADLRAWRAAVSHITKMDDAVFETFAGFVRTLLELRPDDEGLPHRLLDEIQLAEQLAQA